MPKTQRKKILFIGHIANRTGAPIVLLNLLRWLKENTFEDFETIISWNGDELLEEYQKVCPTKHLYLNIENDFEKVLRRITGKTKVERADLVKTFKQKEIGLIYSNTLGNGPLLELLSKLNIPIVTHAHELESSYNLVPLNLQQTMRYTHEFIAASEAVKTFLIDKLSVKPEKVHLVYEFINGVFFSEEEIEKKRCEIRKSLGISPTDVLIISSGTLDMRKGSDLFVQIASASLQKKSNLKFIWVGMFADPNLKVFLELDCEKLGISEKVMFIGEKTNPLDYFIASDIFLMCSREDPFPLVCLENASVGNPIVCFEKSGGSQELVRDDGGIIVPYLDTDKAASAIVELANNPALMKQYGSNLKRRFFENYTIEIQAPRIYEIIKKYL